MPLQQELSWMLRHPLCLLKQWNWKAAAFSAMLRGVLFFVLNLRAGHAVAAKAMGVEVLYATAAAGLAGAATQRLRYATPQRATAAVILLGIPVVMLVAQAAVHHATGTPRLRSSLLASFVFASLATGFNWFAMRQGVFVTQGPTSFWHDLLQVPRLIGRFVSAGTQPR